MRTDHLLTLVDDVGIVQHAHGVIPNRETGYCVDDVARLAVVALELARRGDEQAWTPILYRCARLPARRDRPAAARDAELHGLRPALARRAARRRPRRPLGLGARRGPLDGLGARASSGPTQTPARRARRLAPPATSRCARRAYAVLGLARLDPDRLDAEARLLLERARRAARRRLPRRTPRTTWRWFEDALSYDNARLPQALIVGGAALGRDDDVAIGLESLRWLGDECGLDDGMLRLPGHLRPTIATSRPRARATSSRSTPPRSSRPSWPRSPSPATPEHGARAQLAFDWFLGRNRLDRPLYDFATGGCSDGLGERRPERKRGRRVDARLPSRRSSLLDAAGLPVVLRRRAATGQGGVSATCSRELFRRHPGNPILTAEDWPYPVNAVFNPAAARRRRRDRPARPRRGSAGDLASRRRPLGERPRRLVGRPRAAARAGGRASRASSGASRTRAPSGSSELDRWVITCTAYGPAGPGRLPRDDRGLHRRSSGAGSSCSPEDKNAALLPERVDGKWVLFHRPMTAFGGSRGEILALAVGRPRRAGARPSRCSSRGEGAWWDSLRIGIGPPPLRPSTAGC